jgi:hypothetical protein
MMHLIQILLPLRDNEGAAFDSGPYEEVRKELTDRFGGVTAFSRAPAEGLWKDGGTTRGDDIVVLEVMTDAVDDVWWCNYRKALETRFRQDEIVIRAQQIQIL